MVKTNTAKSIRPFCGKLPLVFRKIEPELCTAAWT